MAGRRPSLPMVVCCSTRDELDGVLSAASNLSYINIAAVYSDLAEAERSQIFERFRQTTMSWNKHAAESEETEDTEERKSHMIILTDACLPLLSAGESPISARVLINYELPPRKETYMRRMATCLAAGQARYYEYSFGLLQRFLLPLKKGVNSRKLRLELMRKIVDLLIQESRTHSGIFLVCQDV